ncbi:MAG: HAD family hydrolase [Sphaerochaeta sp.]
MSKQSINTILFDLDGTLLPLDQKQFIRGYYQRFLKKGVELGFNPEKLSLALERGIAAMMGNDGSMTNKDRFDQVFHQVSGIDPKQFNARFALFYENEFNQLKQCANPSPLARDVVHSVQEKGYTVVLATTPLFPSMGTNARLSWAGLEPSLFSLVTTYEDFHYAKPNHGYYYQILEHLGLEASSCLMIGNDVEEDMVAGDVGMELYLVTDCLINTKNKPLDGYRQGSLKDLARFCKELPPC